MLRYNLFRCQHFEASSLLLFNVIFLSAVMIFSFSARHNFKPLLLEVHNTNCRSSQNYC